MNYNIIVLQIKIGYLSLFDIDYASYTELKGFLLESALMCSFDHPHVLGLVGICIDNHQRSPYLILPFMENGDLKSFLKTKREIATRSTDNGFPEVTVIRTTQQAIFGCFISKGFCKGTCIFNTLTDPYMQLESITSMSHVPYASSYIGT